jgi:hypothetical protein
MMMSLSFSTSKVWFEKPAVPISNIKFVSGFGFTAKGGKGRFSPLTHFSF